MSDNSRKRKHDDEPDKSPTRDIANNWKIETNRYSDVLLNNFQFLTPPLLGNKIATSSTWADALVALHFKSTTLSLGKMEIRYSTTNGCAKLTKQVEDGGNPETLAKYFGIGQNIFRSAFYDSAEESQMLGGPNPVTGIIDTPQILCQPNSSTGIIDTPQPDKVKSFKQLTILYLDNNVVAFLRYIRVIFNAGITLRWLYSYNPDQMWNGRLKDLWDVLKDDVHKLDAGWFHKMWEHRPLVLNDCPKLHSICVMAAVSLANKDGPDNALESYEQALSYWLHTPHADGRPKVLELGVSSYTGNNFVDRMESLKKKFFDSAAPVKYIVVLRLSHSPPPNPNIEGDNAYYEPPPGADPFMEQNAQTKEKLQLRKGQIYTGYVFWMLVRAPINQNKAQEQKWKEWEDEAVMKPECNFVDVAVANEHQDSGLSDVASSSNVK